MKHLLFVTLCYAFAIIIIISCNNNPTAATDASLPADAGSITSGEHLFTQYCEGCHSFKMDGIGPQLSGITAQASAQWFVKFIKDPQQAIHGKDVRATALYKKYKVTMPAFPNLMDSDIIHLISFLKTHNEALASSNKNDSNIKDPYPAKIPLSKLLVTIQPFTQMPASIDSGKTPLTRITQMIVQPATHKLFILDLRGRLYHLSNNKASLYMDMQQLKPNFISQPGLATGFGSIAFHPDFINNGLFYTTHTEKPNSAKANFTYNDTIKQTLQWVLTEWKASNPLAATFSGKGRELFRLNMVSVIHGMQELAFNPNAKRGDEDYGLLYAGIGDGGCTENGYAFLAHNKANLWGTVIRINPQGNNSANKNYGIPASNPFVKTPGAAGEIYAMGFRNPHRLTWLRSGKMLVSNVGQSNIESINMVTPGADFGWPLREGNFLIHPIADINKVYALPANDASFHITYPVAAFDHDEGKAIAGGYEYTGAIAALKNKFLFGDIPTGRLFYLHVSDLKQRSLAPVYEWHVQLNNSAKSLRQLCGNDRVDLHFGRDNEGNMYIMTKADGKIYKIVSAAEN